MKLLTIIGEAPGGALPVTDEDANLVSSAGRNLADIAGWDWQRYLNRTRRLNLFIDPQDDRKWDAGAARLSAERIAGRVEGRIILLGSKVAAAFGASGLPYYQWTTIRVADRDLEVARVPHPSGRNRLWNDIDHRARASAFLRGLLDG